MKFISTLWVFEKLILVKIRKKKINDSVDTFDN